MLIKALLLTSVMINLTLGTICYFGADMPYATFHTMVGLSLLVYTVIAFKGEDNANEPKP